MTNSNTDLRILDVNMLKLATYNPERLLDFLIEHAGLKNDAALARALELPPPVLSKLRHRRIAVSCYVLLRMHDYSELPVDRLRQLMGVPTYRVQE